MAMLVNPSFMYRLASLKAKDWSEEEQAIIDWFVDYLYEKTAIPNTYESFVVKIEKAKTVTQKKDLLDGLMLMHQLVDSPTPLWES